MRHLLRIGSIALAIALVSVVGATIAVTSATSSPSLPTITVAMDKTTITVGGALQSGAVDIRSTTTDKSMGVAIFLRLNPGVTAAQALAFIGSPAGQDPNNISQVAAIVVDAPAPKGTTDVQTTLQPGDYLALDGSGNDPLPNAAFTIAQAADPAALPAAQATVQAIDFGFRGATTLRNGDLVRFANRGHVVHAIGGIRVKNVAAAKQLMTLLRAGKDSKAQHLALAFTDFLEPVSSGVLQQMVVNAKPGVYVLACFEETQDHREHTQLGQLRMIHITK